MHEQLRMFIGPDAYALVGESEKSETLQIDRHNGKMSVFAGSFSPPRVDKEIPVFGIFGIVPLLKSNYLVVITKRTKVGRILDTTIYTASEFAVFPIDRRGTAALLAHPNEAYLLGLLKTHLYSAPFYFTYHGYNVTMRLQQQPIPSKKEQWETADDRFFWNRYLQQPLIDLATRTGPSDCGRFILPVMFGFLDIQSTSINGRPLMFGLISRRSRFRAGTRYFSRGIDRDGNVSNFNETEQILLLDAQGSSPVAVRGDVRFSYVQTRGSVPVFWAEINNLRYKPDLKIMDMPTTNESLIRHFDQQISIYGDQYVVNLVNKSGYEKPVKEAFERNLQILGNPRVHYTYFDFHHECKGLRFDRVSVLIDGLDEELHKQSYFYHDTTTSPTRPQQTQTSVVRTNCMDCLDRTNVVQSALGKWVLNNQLRQAGVLSVKESIDEHPQFLFLFRNVWADNADVVSKAYSGTGALKTDFTRTGKRSKEGTIQDGINSIIRYIKNNFLDGPRQDSYDLVTGSWVPRKGSEPTWTTDTRDLFTRIAPYILIVALGFIILALVASETLDASPISSRRVLLFSLIAAAVSFAHISSNGIDYVAWPKLVVLDDILTYSGQGYESGRRGRPRREPNVVPVVAVDTKKMPATLKKERKESVLPMLNTPSATKRD